MHGTRLESSIVFEKKEKGLYIVVYNLNELKIESKRLYPVFFPPQFTFEMGE